MKKNFWNKFRRAETLIEVLISLGIIASGAATATGLAITALDANQFNKDQLIALNLAQEGLEYMHSWRDSNVMKFSSDKAECWNMKQATASCANANVLLPGNYYLGKDDNATPSDLVSSTTAMNLVDGIGGTDSPYQLNDFYFSSVGGHLLASFYVPNNGTFTTTPTKFYRSMTIDYKKTDDAGVISASAGAPYLDANLIVVTSTVQWIDKNRFREVKLNSMLSNYKQ